MSGSQLIGWDPRLKQIRSWVFDSDGGFSEALWSRDGDRWVIKSIGVVKDGRAASATNILTRVNRDTIRWTSVDRTIGSEVLPDAEEITLVRKPPQPRPSRTFHHASPAGEPPVMKTTMIRLGLAVSLAALIGEPARRSGGRTRGEREGRRRPLPAPGPRSTARPRWPHPPPPARPGTAPGSRGPAPGPGGTP